MSEVFRCRLLVHPALTGYDAKSLEEGRKEEEERRHVLEHFRRQSQKRHHKMLMRAQPLTSSFDRLDENRENITQGLLKQTVTFVKRPVEPSKD